MEKLLTCLPLLGLFSCVAASWAQADEKEEKKYEFKIETVEAQPTMTIRFKVPPVSEKISAKYGEAFGAIVAHILSNGGQPSGAPFGRYHAVKEDELDIEAGLPVVKAIKGEGDIKANELPGGRVATTVHFGPYKNLGLAHGALMKRVSEKGYKPTGSMWESYVTDPTDEADKSKWETKLLLPIANTPDKDS